MRYLPVVPLCLIATAAVAAQPPEPPAGNLAAVIKQLSAPESKDRIRAVNRLLDFGPQAAPAVPKLIE